MKNARKLVMTIVNEHVLCSSDKHPSDVSVSMWHVDVINNEEYKLYKCHNYTFMLCVSTLAQSPAFPTAIAGKKVGKVPQALRLRKP